MSDPTNFDTTGDTFSLKQDRPVENFLKDPTLDVIAVTDPRQLRIIAQKTADQMNKQSKQAGGPVFTDLSDRIADIQIQTSAQGASILEVHVIDPTLALLRHPAKKSDPYSTFIQVADDGYLDPPIEVHFPPGAFKSLWRLCSVRAATMDAQSTEANLILTFEDKIASVLREVNAKSGGVKQSNPNEALETFMLRVVTAAAKATGVTIDTQMMIDETKDPNSAQAARLLVNSANSALDALLGVAAKPSAAAQAKSESIGQKVVDDLLAAWQKQQAAQAAGEIAIGAVESAVSAITGSGNQNLPPGTTVPPQTGPDSPIGY